MWNSKFSHNFFEQTRGDEKKNFCICIQEITPKHSCVFENILKKIWASVFFIFSFHLIYS